MKITKELSTIKEHIKEIKYSHLDYTKQIRTEIG